MQQPVDAKKGEIEFRKKLYEQEVLGEQQFDDELAGEELLAVLRSRAAKTYEQVKKLQEQGIATSPYVEIGAERCQRSLTMENELRSHGAATDISFYSLKSCDYYKAALHQDRAPVRICCDVNNLPFMSDSVPFIFCYETLHHFLDPSPVIRQVCRVLASGGCFFFDEEPLSGKMHFNLYKAGRKHSKQNLAKRNLRKIFDGFFGNASCNEAEHGIIENNNMSLALWKSALSPFDKKKVTISTLKSIKAQPIKTDLYKKNSLKTVIYYLLGGGVSGCCFKEGKVKDVSIDIEGIIACPDCLNNNLETPLERKKGSFTCETCGRSYPVVDGIALLFSRTTLDEFYPRLSDLM